MDVEYDENKSEANRRLRGFGFEKALQFDFAEALIVEDLRHDYAERRWRGFGRIDGEPYCVAFTIRGTAVRIITMHRIHEKEARRYGI